jgi:D-glycerate 3-kinase
MAQWIAGKHLPGQTLFIGINGAQGSGKSTLAGLLELILHTAFNKKTVSISIDDFYYDQDIRRKIAGNVHPLFITRGVPGTHDIDLGLQVFQQLRDNSEGRILIPQFDKAIDDRLPETEWKAYELPVDIVLFEGWCVGAHPQSPEALTTPVNTLEQQEDTDGVWRHAVNRFLADKYQTWFQFLDDLIMLAVPSMEQVYEWRGLQESRLEASTRQPSPSGVMGQADLYRFIMHYERLTRHQLDTMPGYADVYLPLNEQHQIADVVIKQAI